MKDALRFVLFLIGIIFLLLGGACILINPFIILQYLELPVFWQKLNATVSVLGTVGGGVLFIIVDNIR